MKCRLCQSEKCVVFCSDTNREYLFCNTCGFVFVPKKSFLTKSNEKERYGLHDNSINNNGYVSYLETIAEELKRIPLSHPEVLDFGCGKEAVLTDVLKKRNIACHAYDPMYKQYQKIPDSIFDIVVICEVIEHVRDLTSEIKLLKRLIKPNGYLFIKTEFYSDLKNFNKWWYTKDLTHINYFNRISMEKLSALIEKEVFYCNDKNVIIFH